MLSKEVYNEQTKLVATFLSNLGVASVGAGFLTPVFTQNIPINIGPFFGLLLGISLFNLALQVLTHMRVEK